MSNNKLVGFTPKSDEELDHFETAVNAEENPVTYLCLDPGNDNGFCGFDAKFYPVFAYTVPADQMLKLLARCKRVKTIIMEDFRLFPNKALAQSYSRMETVRVIGRIEAWAEMTKVELVLQTPSIKNTGYKWIGQKPPKSSDPARHQKDANVHLWYWAINTKKVDANRVLLMGTNGS